MIYPKAALFDLDGVVLDTESQYSHFWGKMGKHYFPNNPHFAEEIKGSTLVTIFERYFPHPQEQVEVQKALNDFEQQMSYPYIAGVENFIQQLQEANIPTAVVTSSDAAKMETVYAAHPELKEHFDRIFMSEDVKVGKPAPDCYLGAASTLNAPIAECVVFEDSLNGLKAGRASGAKVVALSTTLPVEVVTPYADAVIADFTDYSVIQLSKLFS